MKPFAIALVITAVTISMTTTQARAEDKAVDGLIIGATLGGVFGYIIGNEMDHEHHRHGSIQHRPVRHTPPFWSPSHRPPHWSNDRDRHRRYSHGHAPRCQETIIIKKKHGHYREKVRTICRDDRNRHHHNGWPHQWHGSGHRY